MSKNLFYQMSTAIENGFKPGMDKHSIKTQNKEIDYKIYSYSSRKNMLNFSHIFCDFIKDEYPEIKKVEQIKIDNINRFLSTRKGVTQNTLNSYASCLNKMQMCCNKKFGISVDWKTGRIIIDFKQKDKMRNVIFSSTQIEQLEMYFDLKKDSYSKRAFQIAKRFSLRSSEVVKLQVRDVKIELKRIHIHDSKGKRSRDINMTNEDILFMKKMIDNKVGNERLIPLRANSICAYLNRACKELGFNEIINAKTSYHALRKATIQEYYKKMLIEVGEKRAKTLALERLGHGKQRSDLVNTYLLG